VTTDALRHSFHGALSGPGRRAKLRGPNAASSVLPYHDLKGDLDACLAETKRIVLE